MKYTLILTIAALALLAGCGPAPDMPLKQRQEDQDSTARPANVRDNDRIEVTRIGVFRDSLAYNAKRGVYVIRDKQTGREYVGISGVGISEVGNHLSGKVTVPDER
jgi:hypothetical protein